MDRAYATAAGAARQDTLRAADGGNGGSPGPKGPSPAVTYREPRRRRRRQDLTRVGRKTPRAAHLGRGYAPLAGHANERVRMDAELAGLLRGVEQAAVTDALDAKQAPQLADVLRVELPQ
jgi:hypothetical protein